MRFMKRHIRVIIGLSLLAALFTLDIFAQTNDVPYTNSVPGIGNIQNDAIPTSKEDYWKWAIAVVVPFIMTFIKYIIPKIPSLLIPVLTPVVGLGLGFGLKALTDANLGWVDMTQAGALAVFIREVVHNAMTKGLTPASVDSAGKRLP